MLLHRLHSVEFVPPPGTTYPDSAPAPYVPARAPRLSVVATPHSRGLFSVPVAQPAEPFSTDGEPRMDAGSRIDATVPAGAAGFLAIVAEAQRQQPQQQAEGGQS